LAFAILGAYQLFPKDNSSEGLVLIIDDSIDNLEMIAAHLENANYQVLTANNAEEALQIAQQAQPDAILLDIIMPQIGGFETCKRLKANASTDSIPVIFMTVLVDKEIIIQAYDMGAADYITKPILSQELIARLSTQVQNQQLKRKIERIKRSQN
jgi:PleD family two-component response regulator